MTPERWQRVREVFEAVVELPPAARGSYLEESCGDDAALREEVEALMAADDEAGSFLERPAVADVAAWPTGARGAAEPATPRLPSGTRLGSYEVLSLLGAGGMGCVYRARDLRLGREVALKVLPGPAADSAALVRFQNEVRAVAALNHPAIVTVHDVGEEGGTPFFAMELVEGKSLRALMDGSRLTWRRALGLAAQLARGLAAAHARGIVHRDLKPENVMVGRGGEVKILDFGLAKLLANDPGRPVEETLELATRPGTILGTAGYMSPEQAGARGTDFRTDHFAFGVILYEMLAGRRAFAGATPVETLAAVLRDPPPPFAAGAEPPLAVRWVLDRCLAKDPAERYASTLDLARDVERARDLMDSAAAADGPASRRAGARSRAAAALLAAAMAGAGILAVVSRPAAKAPPAFRYLTHSGGDWSVDVSPDGRLIAFVSTRDGRRRIWLKQVTTGAEAALTDGGAGVADDHPRFSPDGSAVLFARTEPGQRPHLAYLPTLGGAPRRLVEDAWAGDWSPDGTRLVFLRNSGDLALPVRVLGLAGARGEDPREVERFEALAANPPRWSPDSTRVAVTLANGAALFWSVLVYDVGAGARRTLSPPQPTGTLSPAVWIDGGRALLYSQSDATEGSTSGSLVKQDARMGAARTLLHALGLGGGSVDVAGRGAVAFTATRVSGNLREVAVPGAAPGASREPPVPRWLTRGDSDDRQATYAPDGERIVFSSNRDGQLDVWEVSTRTGSLRRLTDSPAEDWDPRLAPSGALLWSSRRSGAFEIWMAERDGSAPRQVTRDGVDSENPAITPDGQWIVYASHDPARRGLWKIRTDGSGAAQLSSGSHGLPEVSPDGTLVLYGAFTPPFMTIYVLRLADGSPVPFQIRLSDSRTRNETGFIRGRPRWMPDGRAIAFLDVDAQGRSGIYVQDFVPGSDTRATRRALAGFEAEALTESYGLSPDGTRLTLTIRERTSHIVLVNGVDGVEP
jgi:Tol biopolymer transport system component